MADERTAKILVIDGQGRVLVLKLGEHRSRPEDSYKPDLPGGLVEPGESPVRAIIRETQEECGINLSPSHVRLVYDKVVTYPARGVTARKFLYVAHLTGTPAVRLSWEHSAYRWTPLDELRTSPPIGPFYAEAIAHAFKNNLL